MSAPQIPDSDLANVDAILFGAMGVWRPPPKLSLSEWADEHFYLSPENAAVPGRWKTLPYQRAIMDAMTDPSVERVTLQKSARIGYTLMVSAAIGYHIHHAPCPIMLVQPTVEDARGYSKETIAPMLRDVPVLSGIVFNDSEEKGPKDSGNTILHKTFPGGVLSFVGANSGSGFRRVSRRVVVCDEVDAYPSSAGSEGDAIKLATMRTQAYWDRKIVAGSTPLVAGTSRIEALFLEGDQQRFHVPCTQCGHMAPLVFRGAAGHVMTWPEGEPGKAFFSCQANGCVIEHADKRNMVERGEWRAGNPHTNSEKRRHASFHIWTAYSFNENTDWADIVEEFLKSKDNPKTLQVFVNTWLGEAWQEQGEAPDWERLYARRERYPVGVAPAEALVVTAGVDVQKDRFVYEVVGWGKDKQSWSVDAGEIYADTANDESWLKLDELLARDFGGAAIRMLAVDSGFRTNTAYNWARRHPMNRVVAIKGSANARAIIGTPSPVDVHVNGKRLARGYKVFTVGTDVAKSEIYGWLKLPRPEEGAAFPPGWCHFPEYGEEYFKQLTAEHLVSKQNGRGFTVHEWQVQPGRQNHWLDCRVYARAAVQLLGLDRMRAPSRVVRAEPSRRAPVERVEPGAVSTAAEIQREAAREAKARGLVERVKRRSSGFLSGARGSGRPRGKGWLR